MTGLPTVALTFDDGPSAWTPMLLDVLATRGARATFFVLGSEVTGHERTLQRIVAEGHELGIHGWDHTPADELPVAGFEASIRKTLELLPDGVRWWRPPWNRYDSLVLLAVAKIGLAWCGVTVDGRDVSRGEDAIVETVTRGLHDGAIVGLHDGIAPNGEHHQRTREPTVRAVGRLVDRCLSVTASELLSRAEDAA